MSIHDDNFSNDENDETILSRLRIYAPDGIGCGGCSTHFVKVSSLKEFRITADSDTDLVLRLEWSMDGHQVNFYNEYQVEANVCLTKQVDVVLQYIRFFVNETEEEKQNCRLKILAFSPDDKAIVKEQPKKSSSFIRNLSFSPKLSPKKSPRSSSRPEHEDRIPHNVYKGSLLVGKTTREVGILPRGNDGDILMIVNGEPQWVSLITLFSHHDEIQKKEREKFVQFETPRKTSSITSSTVSPAPLPPGPPFPSGPPPSLPKKAPPSTPPHIPSSEPAILTSRLPPPLSPISSLSSPSPVTSLSPALTLPKPRSSRSSRIESEKEEIPICIDEEMDGIYDISVSPSNRCISGKNGISAISSPVIGGTMRRSNSKPLPPLPSLPFSKNISGKGGSAERNKNESLKTEKPPAFL
jgi:hypothetical protein